jgi:hypothetical protein
MLAFRCPNISSLSNAYQNFFQDWSFHLNNISNYNDKVFWYFGWLMVIFLFMKEISEETNNVQILKLKNYFREAFYVILIIDIFVFGNFHSKPFIYFQF